MLNMEEDDRRLFDRRWEERRERDRRQHERRAGEDGRLHEMPLNEEFERLLGGAEEKGR